MARLVFGYYSVPVIIGALMVAAIVLTACASPRVLDCTFAKPHVFSDATLDRLTDAEVQQELTHNRQTEALCGAKP